MFSENTFQKNILVDIKRRILMGSGQQVNNRIQDFTIRISFYQVKFTAALFNGNQAAVVWNHG